MYCNLDYIPPHLHKNDRPTDHYFDLNEELYLRIHPDHPTPFETITLADLSLNRSGPENSLSHPEDVLWNIDENSINQRYEHEIKCLTICFNSTSTSLEKPCFQEEHDENFCLVILEHAPLNCNYSHCDMKFIINEDLVITKENFKNTLGGRVYKTLRRKLRMTLHEAVVQKKILFQSSYK